MTPYKPLHIGDHALREMRKALPPLTRADVREVFERGERIPAKVEPGQGPRWQKDAVVARRQKLARIIYIERAVDVEIVTAYWVGEYD